MRFFFLAGVRNEEVEKGNDMHILQRRTDKIAGKNYYLSFLNLKQKGKFYLLNSCKEQG